MKKIIFGIFLLISLNSLGQYLPLGSPFGNNIQRLNNLKTLYLPRGSSNTLNGGLDTAAAVFYNTADSSVYVWTHYQWLKVGGGSSGSTPSLQQVTTVGNTTTTGIYLNGSYSNYLSDQVQSFNAPLFTIQGYNSGFTTRNSFFNINNNGAWSKTGNITANNLKHARGNFFTDTLQAHANGDTLSGEEIRPVFVDNGYTGVEHFSEILKGTLLVDGGSGLPIFKGYSNGTLRTTLTNLGIQSWNINNGSVEVGTGAFTSPVGTIGWVFTDATGNGRTQMRMIAAGGGWAWGSESGNAAFNGNSMALRNNGHFTLTGDPTASNPTDNGYLFEAKGTGYFGDSLTVKTIANGTAGTDSVLVESSGLIKKISATYYGTGTNIYNSDGTFTGNRVADIAGFDFTIQNTSTVGAGSPLLNFDMVAQKYYFGSSGNGGFDGMVVNGANGVSDESTQIFYTGSKIASFGEDGSNVAGIDFLTSVYIGAGGDAGEPSAILQLSSQTRGVLDPRMTMAQRDLISSPATGLRIYQTDNTPGFYYYDGAAWTRVGTGSGTVTSVATGLGLSGGTITSSGTLLVDTASASILSRQRAVNTYVNLTTAQTIAGAKTLTDNLAYTNAKTIYNPTSAQELININRPIAYTGGMKYTVQIANVSNGDGTYNSPVVSGFNAYGQENASYGGNYTSLEPDYRTGGQKNKEYHYEVYHPFNAETSRLFSSTYVESDSLGNSSNQWDFRADHFYISPLKGSGTFAAFSAVRLVGSWNAQFLAPNSTSGIKFQGTGLDATTYMDAVPSSQQLVMRNWSSVTIPTPIFTGTVTIPSPFTLGATSVTTTGTKLNYLTSATGTTGTTSTNIVFSTSPTLVTPILGTPTSVTLTNGTGLPISTGVSGLGTGVATFLATPSSANLSAAVTDETGSGALVFGTSPTFTTPILGTPTSATLTNATGLPEGGLSLTDITTNNTSTSAHGFFPKLTSNTVYYVNNSGALTALTLGANGTVLTSNGATSAPTFNAVSGTGTVTDVSVVTANGVSGSVATSTTTPAITLTLGSITPTLVTIPSGSASAPTLTFSGNTNTGIYKSATNVMAVASGGGVSATFDGSIITFGAWGTATEVNAASGGAGNSNRAGIDIKIGSGKSTGNGAAGNIIFQTAPAGSSGTSQNAYVEAARFIQTTSGSTSLAFNGTTSSFPAIARSTTNIVLTLADATAGSGLGIGMTAATGVAASSIVDLTSTTKGFLPPRMTTTQKNAISSPAEGLVVYDTTLHKLCVYTGSAWETVTSL